jgi:hypothetical protein
MLPLHRPLYASLALLRQEQRPKQQQAPLRRQQALFG